MPHTLTLPTAPEHANGHGAYAPEVHPRLRVQAGAARIKRRHFVRAIRRVFVLGVLDASVLLTGRELLAVTRSIPVLGDIVGQLLPIGLLGGLGSASAFIAGLAFAGSYGSRERWASQSIVFKGAAIGSALALWQSIDSLGWLWTITHWAVISLAVGTCIGALRHVLALIVLRSRLITGPKDLAIFVGDPDSRSGRLSGQILDSSPGMVSLGWLSERASADDYLGHPAAVWEVLCETGTDTMVLCEELSAELFDTLVEAAAVAGCRVLSIRRRGTLLATQPRAMNGPDYRMLELTFPAARAGQDVVKRTFDLVMAALLLVIFSPLFLLVSTLIRLDSRGPVLFVQDRVGQAGTLFPMMKFRTMSDGADDLKDEVAHLNQTGDPRLFKIPNDPRITRVGAVLRRWSLDELPQLLNVLRGEMSLVGPRPFFESDLAAYDDHHFIRLSVKPGVTGLWQVRGRSSILDFEEVVNLDREYVENWSFLLDLRILAATLPAVLRRTGAY